MMAADDWQGLGLHHWSMLALLYGTVPPVSLNENLPSLDVDKRLGIVAQILGLSEATPERKICGPGETGPVIINGRLINKMRDEAYAKRTPIIPWVPYAVTNAIEIWRQTVSPKGGGKPEQRTYYLAPLAGSTEHECYLAISGPDAVIFNIMRSDAKYTNKLRTGELLFSREGPSCMKLCCDRYIEMKRQLVSANAEVLELRQKNRKLRDAAKRLNA